MIRHGHTELLVRDPQIAKRFYVDVLGFECFSEQPSGKIVWLKLGEQVFLLRPGKPSAGSETYQAARAGHVLFTDDLPGALAALQKRGLKLNGDDGPGCPTFTDPDGNWFQLVNPAHQ